MALSRTDRIRAAEGDFLGHPRGLTFLFTTEIWERFSFYGMPALLVLYMVKYLLLSGHGDVVGLGASRVVLESMLGPLGAQPFMAVGHFMMAFEPLFLLALFTLILGNGASSPISRPRSAASSTSALMSGA